MEKRISQNDLEKFYRKEIRENSKPVIEEIKKEKRNTEEKRENTKSIFLCHSHNDKTIVDKIILLFNKLSVDIYVDWMDETMPKVTNRHTAAIIKSKIQHSNRFLFLATYYGLKSKWCDWELGVAYSTKQIDELAILPIESKSGKWDGSEYLHLYPVMRINEKNLEMINSNEISIFREDIVQTISLEEWLTL